MGEIITYTVDIGSDATKGVVKFGESAEKSMVKIIKLSNEFGRITKLGDALGLMCGGFQEAVNAPTGAAIGNGSSGDKSKSNEAIATGGTRNTTVTITVGKFFESMVFNGGVHENTEDIKRKMAEILSQVMGTAETSAAY